MTKTQGFLVLRGAASELERRIARDAEAVERSGVDPLQYITQALEKIADEVGVVTSFEVSPEGKNAISMRANLDMRKLRAMREGN